MKRNLIAAIVLLTTNAAFAQAMLPGDLDGDWSRVQRAPEATSYVAGAEQSGQPNYEYIVSEPKPVFEFIL